MKLLQNKTFALIVCLVAFVISGLIFTNKVFGVSVRSNMDMYYGKIINLGAPTNSNDAATKNYVDSAFTGGSFSWSKLTGFPSACSSDQYVSAVGSSLTCSTPSGAWTSSGSNIYSNNSGYVGIGNTNPSYKLDVNGTINASGFRVSGSSNFNGDVQIASGTRLNFGVGSGTVQLYGANISGNNGLIIAGSANIQGATDIDGRTIISNGNLRINNAGYARNNDNYNESGDIIADDGVWVGGRLRVGNNASIYGTIDMNSNKIKGVATPSYSDEAATKGYVDSALSGVNLWVDSGSSIRPKDTYYINLYDNGKIEASDLNISNTLFGRWITSDSLQSSYDTTVGRNLYANRDVKIDGNAGIGTSPSYSYRLDVYGNANIQGTLYANSLSVSGSKQFVIDHPLDPENKKLIHSSLEGPEVGVYYRGEAQLQNGKAEVVLPSYFEALTRKENRTVLLTPKFDSFDEPVSQLAASSVENGKFKVKATDNNNSSQKFYWEVKAVRSDIAPLEVERMKTEEERKADGK